MVTSFLCKIKAYQYQSSSDIRMRLFFVLNTDLTNGYKLYHGIETITVTANTNKSVSISKPSGWSKIIGAVVSGITNPYTIDYSSVKPIVSDSGVTIIVSNPTASGEFKIGYLLFGV